MKRFWRAVLPNLTIALILATGTVVILASFHPMMGFLEGLPFLVLSVATLLCSLAVCIVLYRQWRRRKTRRRTPPPELDGTSPDGVE
ncbi:MAG: hypothetical protein IJJ43_04075 [Oscillospiraceae bacterium]|nr:hypothetical protein [Oscillospiraceae bacterium]